MKRFMGKNFLLNTDTARELYHEVAAPLPICDFHCHIPVQQIAENQPFASIAQAWLGGDHYKWRAMRIAGVPEALITGDASDEDKFMAWAETMPKLIGNPLYHWTHLELQRYFDIDEPLCPDTAADIWQECNRQITQMRPQGIIADSNVKLVCTTDDPVDSLEWHRQLLADNSAVAVLPAWRPDKALNPDAPGYAPWLSQLEGAVGFAIADFEALKQALAERLAFFHQNGCRLSDHALDSVPHAAPDEALAQAAFAAGRKGERPNKPLTDAYRATLLVFLAGEYSRLGWTMQLHIGAMRNVNPAMFDRLGPDTGYDAIADAPIAKPLAALLAAMSRRAPLPRTLLFTLNDKDNYPLASLIGTLQADGIPAQVNQGPAWWFHDQRDGMTKHLKALANLTPLSEFIGMTTDSRSLLSYTRHEYFRRIFCNLLGDWVENGEYPDDQKALAGIVRKVCYENAMGLFRGVCK
ncbi:MAG: glucuronate isomerase [Oscillospiraceae bacterium]|jgi:glucuronate isomerase|nr:glucuronate isomerase [Oscillospiraceae bacterium]